MTVSVSDYDCIITIFNNRFAEIYWEQMFFFFLSAAEVSFCCSTKKKCESFNTISLCKLLALYAVKSRKF